MTKKNIASLLSLSFSLTLATSPGLAAPPPASQGASLSGTAALDAEERAVLVLINKHRAIHRLPALQISVRLTRAADWMSVDMATRDYFSHTDREGRSPFDRMRAFGYVRYSAAAENLAAGKATAAATFKQWKTSPGHNSNMLDPDVRAIGIARAYDPDSFYGWYWTTDFGSKVDEVVQ